MDGSLARRMATSAVLLGLVVAAFETTVVTSAMPTLTRELGPQTRSPWHHRGMVTSSIYATRMLGGSFTIAALDLVHGDFSLRFALVAAIAGLAGLARPRSRHHRGRRLLLSPSPGLARPLSSRPPLGT
jgi:hypothetical protein